MPSFLDVTQLENLILEIVDAQSVTPKQVFQIRQYYMQAKELHAQGNISLAREIMRTISGIPLEVQDLIEYHFKATGYAEALLFVGGGVIVPSSVKTDIVPERKIVTTEPVSGSQNEDADKDKTDTEISSVDLGEKKVASFKDL